MATPPAAPAVRLLLRILDEAFDRKAWHGTTLRGSIRGLTASEAVRRPSEGRHNVAELVMHAAYWKYTVRRRITGRKRGSFALDGSNWFSASSLTAGEWKEIVGLLKGEHDELKRVVASLRDADLDRKPPGGGIWLVGQLVSGVAAHDLYHTGQIQLVKRIVKRPTD
ncbi:MAG TPA: DinB family protein [Thermoanaerobaculia bacterium]|nr:DinB family protein [Thermoanaerobaculia bacterium]